jgi:lipopolysaccharide biosynthesis protein
MLDRETRSLLLRLRLFDPDWYLTQYPDVKAAGIDPLDHYIGNGSTEGRFPNKEFDPRWYRKTYLQGDQAKKEPLLHYLAEGARNGHAPNWAFGAMTPPSNDVAISPSKTPLARHLADNIKGKSRIWPENLLRDSGYFDIFWYFRQNPDVLAAGVDPVWHYVNFGWKEGRWPNQHFDPAWYRLNHADCAAHQFEPLEHYILFGSKDGLNTSAVFSPKHYLDAHPIARALGMDPLLHAILSTAKEAPSDKSGGGKRPLRFSEHPPFKLPDMFPLRMATPGADIAVVLHLYHPDIWNEMKAAFANISRPFDLFVSLVKDVSDHLRSTILDVFPQARILVFEEDRGRDIARFLAFLQSGALFHYKYICKVHSKRSTYVADGDAWRRQLVDGILGSPEMVESILRALDSDPDLGIVVADGNIYSGADRWTGNERFLDELLPRIGINPDYLGRSFPGGGMFWIRSFVLRSFAGLKIDFDDFEPEPMPVNGALGHALERVYGLVCENAGMRVEEVSVLAKRPAAVPTAKNVDVFAFLLPQFHPIPENDRWWGEGFTEWTNVTRVDRLYAWHRQPRLPADLGFYDLRLPDTRAKQADLARRYGVTGFCYYYYWFNGRRVLERPLEEVVASGSPDLPFMICWANEPWSRNWDGLNDEVLLPQTYDAGWPIELAKEMAPILKDRRYYTYGGLPMLLIYRVRHIPNLALSLRALREALKAQGVPAVHLVAGLVDFVTDKDLPADPTELGLDAYYEFPPHRTPAQLLTPRPADVPADCKYLFDYRRTAESAVELLSKPQTGKRHRGVMVGFDNTARRRTNATIFHGSTPSNFRWWLRQVVRSLDRGSPQHVVFVNAWNEWAEGTTLEPDQDFGRGWLEAVQSALE